MATKVAFQLKDQNGQAINDTGGAVYVAQAGVPAKRAITDKDGVAETNPRALTTGGVEFYVADTVALVDLYIQAPGGEFLTVKSFPVGSFQDLVVDRSNKVHNYVIPFSIADTTAATETDTLFNVPTSAQVLGRLSGAGIRVTTLDAGQVIDVGLLSTEAGGDANGFIAASTLANAAQLIGTNGALFSTNAPHLADAVTAKSISYTLDAGSNTAAGFILLPVVLE